MSKKIEHKITNGTERKRCYVCKSWKPLSCFGKCKTRWDNLHQTCKKCRKQYVIKTKEKRKQYLINNCEKFKKYRKQRYLKYIEEYKQQRIDRSEKIKQYYIKNSEKVKKKVRQYNKKYALYEVYNFQICRYEETRTSLNNLKLLEVKCAYCGRWMIPTNSQVGHRIKAINGNSVGEGRFYCSENCKQACPIYNQKIWPKGFKQATSREVVPLLRQIVLKRDNYECQKCGAITENAQLHVHHIIPYSQNKMQANDPDSCITLCKECHKEVHKQDGCKYNDLKCKKETHSGKAN